MQQKNITIVKPGAGEDGTSEAYDIAIAPGRAARQVMGDIQLGDDYNLTRGNDGQPVDMSADLYEAVEDGEKLFATTAARVG